MNTRLYCFFSFFILTAFSKTVAAELNQNNAVIVGLEKKQEDDENPQPQNSNKTTALFDKNISKTAHVLTANEIAQEINKATSFNSIEHIEKIANIPSEKVSVKEKIEVKASKFEHSDELDNTIEKNELQQALSQVMDQVDRQVQGKVGVAAAVKLSKDLATLGSYYQNVADKLENTSVSEKGSVNNADDNKQTNKIQETAKKIASEINLRDPFSYTKSMVANKPSELPEANGVNPAVIGLLPTAANKLIGNEELPVMRFRGYGESADGKPIGILEVVGMGIYIVGVGDKIGLQAITKNKDMVLSIAGLNRNNIIIETGQSEQQLVVQ